MSPTLALIPAKRHSVGVPDKNWKPIYNGLSCVDLAIRVADDAIVGPDDDSRDKIIVSVTDAGAHVFHCGDQRFIKTRQVVRPPDLPDTMLDVVEHALAQVPGPDDEIIVLLQPTSPLRTAETVKQAIQMLENGGKDVHAVVSVSPTYPHEWNLYLWKHGLLSPCDDRLMHLTEMPTRRQDCKPTYKRDGVVYAFRRSTLNETLVPSIYGWQTYGLVTPPAESLSIDTPEDWDEAVRRLNQCR